ncbi:MAG: hypothetical protein ACHQJ6_03990 [Candidatus Berkiellales bacterium]
MNYQEFKQNMSKKIRFEAVYDQMGKYIFNGGNLDDYNLLKKDYWAGMPGFQEGHATQLIGEMEKNFDLDNLGTQARARYDEIKGKLINFEQIKAQKMLELNKEYEEKQKIKEQREMYQMFVGNIRRDFSEKERKLYQEIGHYIFGEPKEKEYELLKQEGVDITIPDLPVDRLQRILTDLKIDIDNKSLPDSSQQVRYASIEGKLKLLIKQKTEQKEKEKLQKLPKEQENAGQQRPRAVRGAPPVPSPAARGAPQRPSGPPPTSIPSASTPQLTQPKGSATGSATGRVEPVVVRSRSPSGDQGVRAKGAWKVVKSTELEKYYEAVPKYNMQILGVLEHKQREILKTKEMSYLTMAQETQLNVINNLIETIKIKTRNNQPIDLGVGVEKSQWNLTGIESDVIKDFKRPERPSPKERSTKPSPPSAKR